MVKCMQKLIAFSTSLLCAQNKMSESRVQMVKINSISLVSIFVAN